MAGKRRGGSRGRKGGGSPATILGFFLLVAVLSGALTNGTINIPGTDPNSPFNPDITGLPFDLPDVPKVPAPAPPANPAPPAAPTGGYAPVVAQVDALPVKGRAAKTGYSRDEFGPTWADVDGNGCDTRNDILRRDLTGITANGCTVLTGTLNDVYTGKTINFVRGTDTSSAVQIDHRVALSNAWQTGAQSWDDGKRKAFANDPRNLIAVDGPTNGSKGDADTATWLPPNKAYRCDYVAAQVDVKTAYGLWVTEAERDAMKAVLSAC